jgi:hypothetical protein
MPASSSFDIKDNELVSGGQRAKGECFSVFFSIPRGRKKGKG